MAGEVIPQTWMTTAPITPAKVLDRAASQSFREVIVIGVLDSGEEYFAGSTSDVMVMNWMADRFKAACIGPPATMVQEVAPDTPPDNLVRFPKGEPA